MRLKDYRPDGIFTATDKRLADIAKSVEQFLFNDRSSLLSYLDKPLISELAIMLTEFGEDTWYELGMWTALEAHNLHLFGNPLPFSKPENEEASDFPFDEYRLSHFLWNAMMILREQEYFSPHHPELLPLAERLSFFLEKQFDNLPQQSSVARFLSSPNSTGSIVKRKLVWMGTRSYLFRALCESYLFENQALALKGKKQIPYIDDFICQECTLWSGMGVLDVLANTLSLEESQKQEVLSWYERHFSYYEILDVSRKGVRAKNIFTGVVYEFPEEEPSFLSPFKKGMLMIGSAVPFDGEWYWSGVQQMISTDGNLDIERLKSDFFKKGPGIVYRYDKEKAAIAAGQIKNYHTAFLEFFGSDMAEFNTGREAAKALFAKLEYQQKKILGEKDFEKQKEKLTQAGITAESPYPQDFLEHDGGVLVFHNPGIGEQSITNFFRVKNCLQKKGKSLTLEETELLNNFVTENSISKEVVGRFAMEYGYESFVTAFFLHKKPKYWFDYLLRKFKGKDFRNRYPNLAVITTE